MISIFVIFFKPFDDLIISIDKLSNVLFETDCGDFGESIEDRKLNIKSPVDIRFFLFLFQLKPQATTLSLSIKSFIPLAAVMYSKR